MANRHLARSIVLQTLFEIDFRNLEIDEGIEVLKENLNDFGPGIEEFSFIEELLQGIIRKRRIIDEVIEKAAPDWPIAKIAIVDRNVLRVGLFELLFGDQLNVPPKVAINESIELAKTFGGENSGKFVNGVLGAVYKEMGEPGKDDISKKNSSNDDLPVDLKAGAVVYSIDTEGKIRFAMVHDVFGYWTLSKSTVQDTETPEETAKRAILEEINLIVEVKDLLGENEYIANHPERGKVKKQVKYYLAQSDFYPPELLKNTGGLDDVKWFELEQIGDLTMYDDITKMMTKAIMIITGQIDH